MMKCCRGARDSHAPSEFHSGARSSSSSTMSRHFALNFRRHAAVANAGSPDKNDSQPRYPASRRPPEAVP